MTSRRSIKRQARAAWQPSERAPYFFNDCKVNKFIEKETAGMHHLKAVNEKNAIVKLRQILVAIDVFQTFSA